MIPRLTTANENHWEREGTTEVVPQDRHTFKKALVSEGYLSALRYVQNGTSGAKAGLKPFLNTLREGTTEVVPSRTHRSPKVRIFTEQQSRNQTICLAFSLRPSRLSGESAVRN